MCGFVGILNIKNNCTDLTELKKMMDQIVHRGPDDSGFFSEGIISLGFRRLSIIDIEGGHQPLTYENNKYVIVFNGEIYNYIELKKDLLTEGYKFSTNSDTEIILALYSRYKEKCLSMLRGMFSFLIWDREEKKLFGARDPFGIKPLYYYYTTKKIYFASEAKSILCLIENIEINKTALQHYTTYQYVPEPQNIAENIKILESGYYFSFKKSRDEIEPIEYWKPYFSQIQSTKDTDKIIVNRLQESIYNSVKIHMRSNVPVGSFLSGGIDSTIITAVAKKFKRDLLTFTVGFNIDGYSEGHVAKKTAEELDVKNIYTEISARDYIKTLPEIIWHLDSPVADPTCVPLYYLSKEASKHVKVVLSGEGSDELFAGYNIYNEPNSLKIFNHIPAIIKDILKDNIKKIGNIKGKNFIERGCITLEERFFGNARMFNEHEKKALFINYNEKIHHTDITKTYYDKVRCYDDITKMQYIDMETWLKGDILLNADRMTMANSLELRVPFLDREVYKVASMIPTSLKITRETTKKILREAFKDIIPLHVVNRKKLGFPVPLKFWFKNELYNWAIDIFSRSNTGDIFNKKYIYMLIETHKKSNIDYSRKIWTIIVFMLWYEIFIEKKQSHKWIKIGKEIDILKFKSC
ncbi:MAG: asparagine synthase (glutamine-hydrolyzing) [Clostridiales bacterium]